MPQKAVDPNRSGSINRSGSSALFGHNQARTQINDPVGARNLSVRYSVCSYRFVARFMRDDNTARSTAVALPTVPVRFAPAYRR